MPCNLTLSNYGRDGRIAARPSGIRRCRARRLSELLGWRRLAHRVIDKLRPAGLFRRGGLDGGVSNARIGFHVGGRRGGPARRLVRSIVAVPAGYVGGQSL